MENFRFRYLDSIFQMAPESDFGVFFDFVQTFLTEVDYSMIPKLDWLVYLHCNSIKSAFFL